MAGRWKTMFIRGVIAAAVLTYLASFKLPVFAAMEQGMAAVLDQLPSLANDTVSTIMTGTEEQEPATTNTDAEPSITNSDTVADSNSAQPASPQEEAAVNQEPATIDGSTSVSGTTLSTSTEPTSALSSAANVVLAGSKPLKLSPEDQLANFMSTRVGLVSSGTTNFPAHDVDATGEFVFQTPSIYGSHFSAMKGRPISAGYSAFTGYNDGTMNGFTLYKNMTLDSYGNCYIAMSAGGPVSFNGLSMEETELYAQELIGVRTFPITNFWTTDPGDDLPLGVGEETPTDPFFGNDYKATVIKMTASYIQIPNFSLSVVPGIK